MRDLHTPECFANHMGLYAIEPGYLRQMVAAIKAGAVQPHAAAPAPSGADLYTLTAEGVAVVTMVGPVTKGASKYSQANSLDIRRGIRAAVRDKDVKAILIHIDSPGGSVAGTQELADDVRAADTRKPVYAHIDDLGASAAYWVASQARSISANRIAEVGSIGALAVVYDTSEKAKMEGVEVHVIATGDMKAAGAPGTEITKEHLAYFQERVDDAFSHFRAAIEAGRGHMGLEGKALDKVSDGRVYGAEAARGLGLIDHVQNADAAMDRIVAEIRDAEGRERAAQRRARLRR